MPTSTTPPENSSPRTDVVAEVGINTSSVIGLYFGIIRYLLIAFPLMAVILIGASYIWDVERGPGCDFSGDMLGFMGTAVRWYAGVLGVAILGLPKMYAIFRGINKGGR